MLASNWIQESWVFGWLKLLGSIDPYPLVSKVVEATGNNRVAKLWCSNSGKLTFPEIQISLL